MGFESTPKAEKSGGGIVGWLGLFYKPLTYNLQPTTLIRFTPSFVKNKRKLGTQT